MRLTIDNGSDNTPTVAFRFEQDGSDVDVYASGDTFVGWFDLDLTGKIQFHAAYVTEDGPFARTEEGKLVTR